MSKAFADRWDVPVRAASPDAVALLGWSRVSLKDHTTAQVVGGTVLGALAACIAYATLA